VENIVKAAIAEFIGTFALVFFGAGALIATQGLDPLAVALAFGLTLAVMIVAMAHLSGGVFNPAVQAGLWVTGRMTGIRSVVYIGAQLLGATAAALLLRYFAPAQAYDAVSGGVPVVLEGLPVGKAVLIEAAATFFLVWVIFATAIDEGAAAPKVAGFAIGLTLTVGILATGRLTGAALNPAVWFGPALASGTWATWWVWVVGPVAGGIIAAVAYWAVYLRGREPVTP
jgi:aquaporin Z